jgi:hypothetical protein
MLHMLQLYKIISSVSDVCYKYFIWILNMFHTYVASVCFSCFRRMLHKCFMFQTYVRRVTRRARNGAGSGGPACVGGMGGASHLGGEVVSTCACESEQAGHVTQRWCRHRSGCPDASSTVPLISQC